MITVPINSLSLDEQILNLQKYYTFRDEEKISNFLEKYPFLIEYLGGANSYIKIYFPSEKIFIQIVEDMEIYDDVHLVISIVTKDSPIQAMKKLNLLDGDWWKNLPEQGKKYLITMPEFTDNAYNCQ